MTQPIISFKNFTFKYDSQAFPTLKNINLDINKGEKILIAGPSGSGKSTIGRCLNGLIPNIDTGDHVIVLNTKDVILTGNKMDQKIYRHHSGYIGGMKETPARVMLEKNPEKAMTLAVKGMLPHNSLGRAQLKKLRVYAGAEHENQAQKPEVWEVK